jgi:antitoxin MazE
MYIRGWDMETTVQKWGNSLAVRIPKAFAEETGVYAGSPVDISITGDGIVIRRLRRRGVSLDDLLAGVTPENRHDEVDTGPAVGREPW